MLLRDAVSMVGGESSGLSPSVRARGSPAIEKPDQSGRQSGCFPPRCGWRPARLCRWGSSSWAVFMSCTGLASGLALLAEAAFTFTVMSNDESEVLL